MLIGIVICLGFICDRADGFAVNAVFGVVAEKIDIMGQVVFFCDHSLHNCHGGQHIVDGPVGVDHLAGKRVGLDGVAQFV